MVQYTYDAWGNFEICGEDEELGNLNPFRYRGYYYDTETKLYYLQTRYYDPETGRFINMDSIAYANPNSINGLNLYAYCGNNPVMNVDPTGTDWWNDFCNAFAGFFNDFGKGLNQWASSLFNFGNNSLVFDEGFGFDISINNQNSFNQIDKVIDEVFNDVTYITYNIDKFMTPGAAFIWDDVLGYIVEDDNVGDIISVSGFLLAGLGIKLPTLISELNGVSSLITFIGGLLWLRSHWRK